MSLSEYYVSWRDQGQTSHTSILFNGSIHHLCHYKPYFRPPAVAASTFMPVTQLLCHVSLISLISTWSACQHFLIHFLPETSSLGTHAQLNSLLIRPTSIMHTTMLPSCAATGLIIHDGIWASYIVITQHLLDSTYVASVFLYAWKMHARSARQGIS